MQALTKVWNDNDYPHIEKYKGNTIEIAPHRYVEMDPDEAEQFRGQYTPRVLRGDDTDDPRFFKKIRLEHPESRVHQFNPLTSPITGKVHESEESLKAEFAHFKHLQVRDENEKANTEVQSLVEKNARLEQEIAEIKAMLSSNKRTRRSKPNEDMGTSDAAGDTDS